MIVQYFFRGEKLGGAGRTVYRAMAAAVDELATGKWPAVRIGALDSRYASFLGLAFEAPDPDTGLAFRNALEGRMRRRGIVSSGRQWSAQKAR